MKRRLEEFRVRSDADGLLHTACERGDGQSSDIHLKDGREIEPAGEEDIVYKSKKTEEIFRRIME
jgi:hypothetical protein